MSIKFNAGMQEVDTKEGQLSAFQRTSWLFPRPVDRNYTTLSFFPKFLFCSLNVTEKKKQPLNHSGRVCQQLVSSHKSSYAHICFSLCREIPEGPVPPPLTQIGNVTHLRGKARAAERHRHASSGETSSTTGSKLGLWTSKNSSLTPRG